MHPQIKKTDLPGLLIVEPICFKDARGFLYETFHQRHYAEVGLNIQIYQTYHSHSTKNVLRGMHYQTLQAPIGKLVRCSRGRILDIVVDLRTKSPTFGKWFGIELNEENCRQLWIPVGFAHGFLALSEADVQYQQTGLYAPDAERTLAWNDPDVNIAWPIDKPVISEKDGQGISLAQYLKSPDFEGDI